MVIEATAERPEWGWLRMKKIHEHRYWGFFVACKLRVSPGWEKLCLIAVVNTLKIFAGILFRTGLIPLLICLTSYITIYIHEQTLKINKIHIDPDTSLLLCVSQGWVKLCLGVLCVITILKTYMCSAVFFRNALIPLRVCLQELHNNLSPWADNGMMNCKQLSVL